MSNKDELAPSESNTPGSGNAGFEIEAGAEAPWGFASVQTTRAAMANPDAPAGTVCYAHLAVHQLRMPLARQPIRSDARGYGRTRLRPTFSSVVPLDPQRGVRRAVYLVGTGSDSLQEQAGALDAAMAADADVVYVPVGFLKRHVPGPRGGMREVRQYESSRDLMHRTMLLRAHAEGGIHVAPVVAFDDPDGIGKIKDLLDAGFHHIGVHFGAYTGLKPGLLALAAVLRKHSNKAALMGLHVTCDGKDSSNAARLMAAGFSGVARAVGQPPRGDAKDSLKKNLQRRVIHRKNLAYDTVAAHGESATAACLETCLDCVEARLTPEGARRHVSNFHASRRHDHRVHVALGDDVAAAVRDGSILDMFQQGTELHEIAEARYGAS